MQFPKYQISKFHGGREVQSVFRTNDKTAYEEQLKAWLKDVEIDAVINDSPKTTAPAKKAWSGGFKRQQAGEICNKCNSAKIVLNPNSGKTFCEAKCWLKMGEV